MLQGQLHRKPTAQLTERSRHIPPPSPFLPLICMSLPVHTLLRRARRRTAVQLAPESSMDLSLARRARSRRRRRRRRARKRLRGAYVRLGGIGVRCMSSLELCSCAAQAALGRWGAALQGPEEGV
jgi:hypothetical protein